VGRALVLGVAGAEVAAVIGGVDDDRVVQLAQRLEGAGEATQVGVDRRAAGQVLRVVPAPVAEGALKVGGHVVVPKPLGPPLGSDRAAPVVLMMRFEKRHKHEERPLVVRLVLEGLEGQVGDGVDPKAGQLHPVAVAVEEVAPVGERGRLQRVGCEPQVLVAAPTFGGHRAVAKPGGASARLGQVTAVGGQVPLAQIAGPVVGRCQLSRQRCRILGERPAVAPAPGGGGHQPGLQRRPGRSAQRLHGE
jgi:hypothetical protein